MSTSKGVSDINNQKKNNNFDKNCVLDYLNEITVVIRR